MKCGFTSFCFHFRSVFVPLSAFQRELYQSFATSREWEKMDPEDGDYDDGRTWDRRRSEKELAYIQQLANEPNLEKEQEKHTKRKVK